MSAAPPTRPLMTAAQVAALLSVSTKWVYELARSGELPAVRIRAAVRFRPEDIDAWVQAARTTPRAGTTAPAPRPPLPNGAPVPAALPPADWSRPRLPPPPARR